MNILVITLQQSKVLKVDILDWLTKEENHCGHAHERYWIVNCNANLINIHNDYEVQKLISLLHLSTIHNYTHLMIKKDV